MFGDFGTPCPQAKGGSLRALGATIKNASRSQIPPLSEVGLPGFDASSTSRSS
jgi:hypothetical protein